MITRRSTPRTTVYHWLVELAHTANAEKAEHSLAKLQEIALPLLAMTAASEAADPAMMRGLLRLDSFPERAERYIHRNACLAVGLPPIKNNVSLAAKVDHQDRRQDYAKTAIALLRGLSLGAIDMTGRGLSDRIEEVTVAMPKNFLNSVEGTDPELSTLLREVVGLPGDSDVCELVTDPAVLANAGHALRRLGADVAPEAFAALGVEDPDGRVLEDSPQP